MHSIFICCKITPHSEILQEKQAFFVPSLIFYKGKRNFGTSIQLVRHSVCNKNNSTYLGFQNKKSPKIRAV
ncbi:hypothetical protein HMPREF9999_01130 [Alloprevotella sp. oral taxon 473 str. F0040]|nr:hypothetical protein HMPREF9999_01130 [Alloprevotella sp. oral taxon 473 str. F0040]